MAVLVTEPQQVHPKRLVQAVAREKGISMTKARAIVHKALHEKKTSKKRD